MQLVYCKRLKRQEVAVSELYSTLEENKHTTKTAANFLTASRLNSLRLDLHPSRVGKVHTRDNFCLSLVPNLKKGWSPKDFWVGAWSSTKISRMGVVTKQFFGRTSHQNIFILIIAMMKLKFNWNYFSYKQNRTISQRFSRSKSFRKVHQNMGASCCFWAHSVPTLLVLNLLKALSALILSSIRTDKEANLYEWVKSWEEKLDAQNVWLLIRHEQMTCAPQWMRRRSNRQCASKVQSRKRKGAQTFCTTKSAGLFF